jgi:hypothetical protein
VSRGKRQAPAPLTLGPNEWVSFNLALVQIQAAGVGSSELGVRDLHRDLCSGRMIGASRRIGGKPEREKCEIHKKSFWRELKLSELEGRVRVWTVSAQPNPKHILYRGRCVFYVRRVELDKHYPRERAETARPTPEGLKRRPGPKPTNEWPIDLAAALIRKAHDEPKALQNVDALVKAMQTEFDDAKLFLPKDAKPVRALIVRLLKYIR